MSLILGMFMEQKVKDDLKSMALYLQFILYFPVLDRGVYIKDTFISGASDAIVFVTLGHRSFNPDPCCRNNWNMGKKVVWSSATLWQTV